MVAYALCDECRMDPPEHCHGTSDRLAMPDGVYGGFICSCDCNPRNVGQDEEQ